MLTRGQVTRKLQATGRSYADVLALEMAAKAEDFANALENGFIQGNLTAATAEVCNGFLTLLFAETDQIVNNGGNTTGNTDLTLDKLDEAIDLVKGSAQRSDLVIVGSFAGLRQVNAALIGQQQFNDVTEIAAGFRVRTYDGIPLIVSTEVPNVLETNNKALTGVAGSGTCIMVLNTRYCYISELTPVTVMPLAKKSSQFDEFDMYWDGSPVLANTKGGSLLVGLKTV